MTRILAIDPGLANTGLVLFDNGRIVDSVTIKTEGEGRKTDYCKALARCAKVSAMLTMAIAGMQPDEIACELYRDIPGHLRKASNRWTTPMLLGYLQASVFEPLEARVTYQDPEVVMTQYRSHIAMWAAKQRGICKGDEQLTNEHLRSAAAHGLFYIDHRIERTAL